MHCILIFLFPALIWCFVFWYICSHGASLQWNRSWNMSGLLDGHPSYLILLQLQRVVKLYVKIAWLYWRQSSFLCIFNCDIFFDSFIYIIVVMLIQFNNMQLLSEEIFDFSRGEMTQQKIKELKSSLNRLGLSSTSFFLGYLGGSVR